MTENIGSPLMPVIPKMKKNAIAPFNEEQLQKIRHNLPLLDLTPHKNSVDNVETNLLTTTPNYTNPSGRIRSGTFDTIKSAQLRNKSPTRNRKKFSMEDYGGRLDGFGYPILKGGKKHRISFKEDMVKVIKVENWKSFNIDSSLEQKKKCFCNLI